MPANRPVTVAVDAGTTGVRALVVDEQATVVDIAARQLTQHFPRPGWVEHDPREIWSAVQSTLAEVAGRLAAAHRSVAAIGITNQRETVVAWSRADGRPLHRALVWQDRRTAAACDALVEDGHLPLVRERTGLVLDPYFSATKMQWMLSEGGLAPGGAPPPDLALGTVDSWVAWHLTGGPGGGRFVTDATNASRTMLFDIVVRRWSDELCDLFGVPMGILPDVLPSCGRIGRVAPEALGRNSPLAGVPLSGMAGDQHAALFGQACFEPGMVKATYGTGSFVLMNAGPSCPPPTEGLVTTLAWDLGSDGVATIGADEGRSPGIGPVAYALEGSVFASGAAIQWLRDSVGMIDDAADLEPLARSVESSDGVVVVPAFTGLGSPHWDPYARGTIVGLTRGSGRAHLARAVVEAISFQVRDVVDAMSGALADARSGAAPRSIRVDGGAAVMDLLLQLQADQCRLSVARPRSVETTGLGAAMLAGMAEGVWGSLDDLAQRWEAESVFEPLTPPEAADAQHQRWRRALDRSRRWAPDR